MSVNDIFVFCRILWYDGVWGYQGVYVSECLSSAPFKLQLKSTFPKLTQSSFGTGWVQTANLSFFQSAVPKLSPKSVLSEFWKCALPCCHCHCHCRCQRVQLTRHMTSHPAVNCVIVACQSSPTQLPFIDWIIWSVAGAFTRKCDWSWFVQTFSSAAN